jgi:hypothetical protein
MQFAPGQLADYPATHPFTELGASFGWVSMIFLQTPGAVAVSNPSNISAFCADLATHSLLHGQAAEDGDSVFDDSVRYKNPPAGSGLVDPATGLGTNTHLNISMSHSYRDLDGDGVANGDTYDTCARVDNTAGVLADWDPTGARPQARDTDQDGIPEEDTNADTVIDVDDGCDNIVTVGLGRADHEGHPETEIGGACANALDDDKDGRVNDGCLAEGDPEVNQCQNNTDDDTADSDGKVNDGCPQILGFSESGSECDNAIDDDNDSRVNDGCPQSGGTSETDQCDNALNDDGDGTVNDGCFIVFPAQNVGDGFTNGDDNCPIIFNPLQVESELSQTYTAATGGAGGPKTDGMGDECDTNPNLAEGDYRVKVVINAKCMSPGTDSDGDGYCDATETALGSLPGDAGSTPEDHAVHPPFPTSRAGAEVWGTASDGAATACSDGIDNDGDTDVDGADTGGCGSANDGDEDGLDDVGGSYTDNCPGDDTELPTHPLNVAAYNPTQKDSDKDGTGDACDTDTDGDGWATSREKWMGTDFNNVCPNTSSHDPWHVDQNRDKKVNVVDTLGVSGWKNAIAAGADMLDPLYSPRLDLIMDDVTDPSVPGDGIGGPTKRADIDSTDWLGIGGFKDLIGNTCGNGSVSIDSDGDTSPDLVAGEDFYAGTPAGGPGSFFDRTYSLNPDWRVQVTSSDADLSTISYKVTCPTPNGDVHTFDIKWTDGVPPNELDTGGSNTITCNDSSKVTVTILATHADVYDGP